ncbi:MAG: hypothetical protein ACKVWR_14155 [Acidimicrobiales bacterium]
MDRTDAALARLLAALDVAGLARPAPGCAAAVRRAERAAAPRSLPRSLARLWGAVALETAPVDLYPRFCSVDDAIALRRRGAVPAAFLPIAAERQVYLLVELDGAAGPGGSVFEWGSRGCPFSLRHHGLAELLEVVAALLATRAYELRDGVADLDGDRYHALVERRLAGGHPVYGRDVDFGPALDLPARWAA